MRARIFAEENRRWWTLGALFARLCEWAYEVYYALDHPALGQSPHGHDIVRVLGDCQGLGISLEVPRRQDEQALHQEARFILDQPRRPPQGDDEIHEPA